MTPAIVRRQENERAGSEAAARFSTFCLQHVLIILHSERRVSAAADQSSSGRHIINRGRDHLLSELTIVSDNFSGHAD